ncbi:MAG: TIGR03943 family protein [Candidatus Abawacabacteria bacterium]|nr:TIGR03943 family protein [Candidatus Abawacabacteria bacterium]
MLAKKGLFIFLFAGYGLGFLWLLAKKKLLLFLHPDFVPLAVAAAVIMLLVAFSIFSLAHYHAVKLKRWRILLLCLPLLLICFTDLKPLSSIAAAERGINTGALTVGRRFTTGGFATKPEKRSLYQWVIALNADPEPSHYEGQAVNVKGFIMHQEGQTLVARFILTCCAADARVLSLPIKSTQESVATLKDDQWVHVMGKMAVEEKDGKRSLIVIPTKVDLIAIPEDPYEI